MLTVGIFSLIFGIGFFLWGIVGFASFLFRRDGPAAIHHSTDKLSEEWEEFENKDTRDTKNVMFSLNFGKILTVVGGIAIFLSFVV